MKIRQGFVSNSSSSSFLIYGITLTEDEILEKFKSELSAEDLDDYENGDFDFYGFLEEKLGEDVTISQPFENDFYIGKSWSLIKDEQTGREFKQEVEKEIDKLGFNKEFSTLEEAYYN